MASSVTHQASWAESSALLRWLHKPHRVGTYVCLVGGECASSAVQGREGDGVLSLGSHLLVVLSPFFPGQKCMAHPEPQGVVQSAEPAGGRRGGMGRICVQVCSLFLKEEALKVRVRNPEFPPLWKCSGGQQSFTKCWRSAALGQVLPLSRASLQSCRILDLLKTNASGILRVCSKKIYY